MSNFVAVRDAIKATLDAIAGIGVIQSRERYATATKEIRTFYAVEDLIAGGFIRRKSRVSESPEDATFYELTSWEIHYMRSFVDDDNSSDAFDVMLDAIAAAFEENVTLGGIVQTTKDGGQAAIQLLDSKPAMFGGILVHYAVMSLKTIDVYLA